MQSYGTFLQNNISKLLLWTQTHNMLFHLRCKICCFIYFIKNLCDLHLNIWYIIACPYLNSQYFHRNVYLIRFPYIWGRHIAFILSSGHKSLSVLSSRHKSLNRQLLLHFKMELFITLHGSLLPSDNTQLNIRVNFRSTNETGIKYNSSPRSKNFGQGPWKFSDSISAGYWKYCPCRKGTSIE